MCWLPLTTLLNCCLSRFTRQRPYFLFSKLRRERVTADSVANNMPFGPTHILLFYTCFSLSKPLSAALREWLLTSGEDPSHFTPNACRIRVSPMVKSLYKTARKAYWTETLRVLHHASCVVTPPQYEHVGSALCWLVSYGVNCANIGVLPFFKS